ncbi:MAG: hypothetical protein QG630_287 [Patescibacteria group bacterium]|nr:hypothetical protein [Patescibacteria group bacterium]
MQLIKTLVILSSQFHNIWEGVKPASLTYKAFYGCDDEKYLSTYNRELVEEVAMQTDFWDCVNGYNESYSVEVEVCDDIPNKEELEKHLTLLVLSDMKIKTGKNPEDSFLDKMSEEENKRIDEGVAWVRRNFPGLGY